MTGPADPIPEIALCRWFIDHHAVGRQQRLAWFAANEFAIKYRKQAGVGKENAFLLEIGGADKHGEIIIHA